MLKRVRKYATPYAMYIKIAVVAAVLGGVGTHLWNDREQAKALKDATEELGTLKQTNAQTLHSLGENEKALTECLDANAWNALQAKDMELKAANALANVRRLEELNTRNAEDIHREETNLRNRDQECRTVDQPLPAWALPDSLWNN